MSTEPAEQVTVLIIGAGPAGLTAAAGLARRFASDRSGRRVLVLDREKQAGGIPRHSDHPGYGIRDLRRFVSGPDYAKRLRDTAVAAGAEIRTECMVTGWAEERVAEVTAPTGRCTIGADAVVLATGARERPRPARLVPGDRPAGVLTTGQLQNLVHLHDQPIGRRAVVVGAELVSWSAVLTLRAGGARTVLMTSEYPSPESYGAFNLAGRVALRVPVATRTRLVRVTGRGRVESVEVEDLDTGRRRTIDCDTVVFTGDWIPDHELARAAGLDLDPSSRGPLVDADQRTSKPGLFAIGNLLHPVDTADIAALDGRHVVDAVLDHLAQPRLRPDGVRLLAAGPLRWISPGLITVAGAEPARRRYLAWSDELIRRPRVSVHQRGRELAARTLVWPASPGRIFRIPSALFAGVRPDAGDVTVRLGRAGPVRRGQ